MSSTCVFKSSVISQDQIDQYHNEGYMILERVIPDDLLQMLREESSYFMGYKDAEMDAQNTEQHQLTIRRNRYFIGGKYHTSPRLWRFVYSDIMAEVCKAALGPDAYLFNEQWVIKAAEKGGAFSWHQDSGYVGRHNPHKPYLSCWCTLDDVDETNGSVYLLPHSRGGTRGQIIDHVKDEKTQDLVGYTGDDPGIPVIAPAGSVVAFTSLNFHRSGRNTTSTMRRIYLTQYSSESILNTAGKNWAQAVPFVKNGKTVYDYAADMGARGIKV